MIGDLFPEVDTPPFVDRYRKRGYSGMVECVVCGATGYPTTEEQEARFKWWTRAHRRHVRCSCGAVVSRKGIASHRARLARFGKPCPPVKGAPS